MRRFLFLTAVALALALALFVSAPLRDLPSDAISVLPAVEVFQESDPLADSVNEVLSEREGRVSVVLRSPEEKALDLNGGRRLKLASLAKVWVLVGTLSEEEAGRRELTDYDRHLMQIMIQQSDNEAAAALYADMDTAWTSRFLRSHGVPRFVVEKDRSWGDIRGSADGVAILLLKLRQGELLNAENTEFVLSLLRNVASDQRWGVTAGLPYSATAALKDGWYPDDDDDWRMHSAGIIEREDGFYVLVLLSSRSPSFQYGLETLEQAATIINTAMAANAAS